MKTLTEGKEPKCDLFDFTVALTFRTLIKEKCKASSPKIAKSESNALTFLLQINLCTIDFHAPLQCVDKTEFEPT